MHTITEHKFNTEKEAQEFADFTRISKFPDKYVVGPIFRDEDFIFEDIPWANTHQKYWLVTIEIYN